MTASAIVTSYCVNHALAGLPYEQSRDSGPWRARRSDPLLEIAMELERVATHDPYFVQRGLYPNVDFYSGIVLRALGVRSPPAAAQQFAVNTSQASGSNYERWARMLSQASTFGMA